MHGTSRSSPVPQVELRLYFRNGYGGTDSAGERVFDVVLDGTPDP